MSMYRQLWLAIIVSMLLALLGSLLAATLSARSYLSEQLSMKNNDNAAALALSLSQKKPDPVEMELAVAALFDSGHYELIRVTDPFGKTIIERYASTDNNGVPRWFASTFPIVASSGRAQISDGWKQIGNIELASHSRFAYRALWKSVIEMSGALGLAGLIGGWLGSLVLARLRKPLGAVISQAQAITERRFITIPEPAVPELKRLAGAMNTMVGRLKCMFEEEAARLDEVRREANCDSLTGLANRSNFMARLRHNLADEDSPGGSIMVIRVAPLADINHGLGREATDELLRRIAVLIGNVANANPEGLAGRLNGADFGLLLPGVIEPQALAEPLLEQLAAEAENAFGEGAAVIVGIGHYPHGIEESTVLAKIDAALANGECHGGSSIEEAALAPDDDAPRSADEWQSLIHGALEHHWVRLVSFPVVDMAGRVLHQECPLRLMLDPHGKWLPAGEFLPMAERLKLTRHVDNAAVTLGLEDLHSNPALPGLAINLSASSLQGTDFRNQLLNQLRHRPAAAKRLWIEVAEIGAMRHFDDFRDFVLALKGTGCRIGIEHFGRQSSRIGLLHDLGLDYLKVDASFVRNLDTNVGNQAFLKGLAGIAHGIGLTVIAEGVTSDAELAALANIGFDGATGPAINGQQ